MKKELDKGLAEMKTSAGETWAKHLFGVKVLIGRLWRTQAAAFQEASDMNDPLEAFVFRVILLTDAQDAARVPPSSAVPSVAAPLALTVETEEPGNCVPTGSTPIGLAPNPGTLVCGQTEIGSTSDCAIPIFSSERCGGLGWKQAGTVQYTLMGTGEVVTISTCHATTDFNIELKVYENTESFPDTCVTANDNNNPYCAFSEDSSEVTFLAKSGTQYLVYVHGNWFTSGNFGLSVACAPALACEQRVTGSTMNVAPMAVPYCSSADSTVVSPVQIYGFAATGEVLTLSICGASFASAVAVVDAGAGGFAANSCIAAASSVPECDTITLQTEPGRVYKIFVGGTSESESGSFELHATCTDPEEPPTFIPGPGTVEGIIGSVRQSSFRRCKPSSEPLDPGVLFTFFPFRGGNLEACGPVQLWIRIPSFGGGFDCWDPANPDGRRLGEVAVPASCTDGTGYSLATPSRVQEVPSQIMVAGPPNTRFSLTYKGSLVCTCQHGTAGSGLPCPGQGSPFLHRV